MRRWKLGRWFFVVYRHKMGERKRTYASSYGDFDGAHFAQHVFHTSMNILCDILSHVEVEEGPVWKESHKNVNVYLTFIHECMHIICSYFIQLVILVCHKVLLSTFWYSDSGLTAASYCLSRPSQLLEKISLNIATDGEKYNVAAVFDI